MTDINKQITELEELMAKAEPRPWHFTQKFTLDDWRLILAMHNALPELITECKKSQIRKARGSQLIEEAESAIYSKNRAEAMAYKYRDKIIEAEAELDAKDDLIIAMEECLKAVDNNWSLTTIRAAWFKLDSARARLAEVREGRGTE